MKPKFRNPRSQLPRNPVVILVLAPKIALEHPSTFSVRLFLEIYLSGFLHAVAGSRRRLVARSE